MSLKRKKTKENILLLIAARGGSKGIKDKNIRPMANQPLIAYTIRQAIRWGKADQIVVSTDSTKIARIATRYGAVAPFKRPSHLSTDTAPKGRVIQHALRQCEKIYGKKFDILVDLDVTAPIRRIQDLDRCLAVFRQRRPNTLFSVTKSHKNPYFNMVEVDGNGFARICKSLKNKFLRRQDAPRVFDLNASIYFYSRDYLLKPGNPHAISKRSIAYVMDDSSGIDIDREIDFKFVEFLLKERQIKL